MNLYEKEASSNFSFEYNTTSYSKQILSENPKNIAIYLNYFDCYECPYYTDRADLIAPEINRMAQMMRAFNIPIIFHTKTVKESSILDDVQNGIKIGEDLHLEETSPLLDDKCLFNDYNDNPAQCNGSIHHDILYSTSTDYFVNSHEHAVDIILKLGVKYVITGGMRCNYWLPPFFEALKNNFVKPIYLYDLSDVAFFRAAQKKKLDTHTKALAHFWNWIMKNYGATVNHFSLIDRLIPKDNFGKKIKFDGNKDAYYFYEYFGVDL